MVEVDAQIVLGGLICLTIIYIIATLKGVDNHLGMVIVGIIGLAIGVVVPTPKIDNNKGVLKW